MTANLLLSHRAEKWFVFVLSASCACAAGATASRSAMVPTCFAARGETVENPGQCDVLLRPGIFLECTNEGRW
jgi:hypothetical protein